MRGLVKRYDGVEVLRGIGFTVAAGEIFGLLGPNGAGKTTTLECLLGLRRADAGTVTIAGIDALARPADVRRLVGAQLQSAALQDKLTVRQALRLFASFHADPENPDRLLERFALGEKADAPFDSLSGGQRQRLLLALAFVHRPRVVVLDEPTAGLDPQARRELHRLIRERRDDGCTILLSTHQLEEAHQLCDRIGILHEGRIVADAPPAELIAGSRAEARVAFRAVRPLASAALAALPGVRSVEERADAIVLGTREVGRSISALVGLLEGERNELLDLQIHRPTLEDVFIELTGARWNPAGPEVPS